MSSPPVRCIVVGLGGIGSWLAHGLARALEYGAPGSQLWLIDGDTFEDKNTERQTFSGLGNKAQIVRRDIASKFPSTTIIARAAWVVDDKTLEEIDQTEDNEVSKISPSMFLQEGDHVFAVVDNYATRKLLFDAAQAFDDIDVYTGGNGEDLSGSMYHYARADGEDITHHPGLFHDEFVNPPDKNPGSMTCDERAQLEGGSQILASNMTVASLLLAKVSSYLLGSSEQRAFSLRVSEIQFDMAYGLCQSIDWRVDQQVSVESGDSATAELASATTQ